MRRVFALWGSGSDAMAVQSGVDQVAAVLERVPWTLWVMTSSYDGQRAGAMVRWVQRCSDEPVLVSVSLQKCHSLEPLIRDSRGFALNLISETDRLLQRTFDGHRAPDEISDSFESLAVDTWRTGSPILRRSLAAFDCEVVRHLDLESDCELFIGQVVEARVLSAG